MGQAASSALAGDEVCFHRKGTFTVTYSTENSSSLPDTATVTGARGTRAQEGRSNVSGGKLMRGGSPVPGEAGPRGSGPSGNQGARNTLPGPHESAPECHRRFEQRGAGRDRDPRAGDKEGVRRHHRQAAHLPELQARAAC